MDNLTCTGKDGIARHFDCKYEYDEYDNEWFFRVSSLLCIDEFFEMRLKVRDDNLCQVVMINNHGREAYVAKGIPESLLPFAAKICGHTIISSQRDIVGEAEFQTLQAVHMWQRLVNKELAYFDEKLEVFVLR